MFCMPLLGVFTELVQNEYRNSDTNSHKDRLQQTFHTEINKQTHEKTGQHIQQTVCILRTEKYIKSLLENKIID